jgi:hypothetical protein
MTGLIRKATLLVVLALVATACVATAGIPSAANSTVPAFVNLVACDGSGALPPTFVGTFPNRYKATVTVLDAGNFPVVNSQISLSFCSDVHIYSSIPGGTVVGVVFTNTAVTDAAGQATVEISGAGMNSNGSTFGTNGANCVSWYADTYFLGTSNVSAYDEDGATSVSLQGVLAADLTRFTQDKLAIPAIYKPRSDFNNLGTLDASDLTFFAQYKLALPSYNSSCGTLN